MSLALSDLKVVGSSNRVGEKSSKIFASEGLREKSLMKERVTEDDQSDSHFVSKNLNIENDM